MAYPFVYTPQSYPTPYLQPYYNQQAHSPFIPPDHLYPHSPFSNTSNLPGTPTSPGYSGDPWAQNRPPSWHAGAAPGFNPWPPAPAFIQAPAVPYNGRRHSFGSASFQLPWAGSYGYAVSPWVVPSAPSQQYFIHPYLNGDSLRSDFEFDLSGSFAPSRIISPGRKAALTLEELRQPATHPPINKLRIVCDEIPQWPIELKQHHSNQLTATNEMVPITLGDVLIAIHKTLHAQIRHGDWAQLSLKQEQAVARAYTKRCKNAKNSEEEASKGVRKVDFLLEKVNFRGLVPVVGHGGTDMLKMLVG